MNPKMALWVKDLLLCPPSIYWIWHFRWHFAEAFKIPCRWILLIFGGLAALLAPPPGQTFHLSRVIPQPVPHDIKSWCTYVIVPRLCMLLTLMIWLFPLQGLQMWFKIKYIYSHWAGHGTFSDFHMNCINFGDSAVSDGGQNVNVPSNRQNNFETMIVMRWKCCKVNRLEEDMGTSVGVSVC